MINRKYNHDISYEENIMIQQNLIQSLKNNNKSMATKINDLELDLYKINVILNLKKKYFL